MIGAMAILPMCELICPNGSRRFELSLTMTTDKHERQGRGVFLLLTNHVHITLLQYHHFALALFQHSVRLSQLSHTLYILIIKSMKI